jgi:hypothetical protein
MLKPIVFDQSSGAILWNSELLPTECADLVGTATQHALTNENLQAVRIAKSLYASGDTIGIDYVSSVWHEKRHFIDWLLTNYGAFKFRMFGEMMINAPSILSACNGKRFAVPIDFNSSKINRQVFNLSEPSKDFLSLSSSLAKHKEYFKYDSFQPEVKTGLVNVNGDALMESMGYSTQNTCIIRAMGVKAANDWFDSSDRSVMYNTYRWMERVLFSFDLVVDQFEHDEVPVFHIPMFYPLVYASLAIRPKSDLDHERYSTFRLMQIGTWLKQQRADGLKLPNTVEESWDLVNKCCLELYGRSVIDNIDEDLENGSKLLQKIEQANDECYPPLVESLKAYQHLREKLYSEFKETPSRFLNDSRFFDEVLPRLYPVSVVVAPSGRTDFGNESWHTHWQNFAAAWGGSLKEWPPILSDGAIVLDALPSWRELISVLSPIAKVFINGFADPSLIGPETERILKILNGGARQCVIPHMFASSEFNSHSVLGFQKITRNRDLKCDFCSKSLLPEESMLVSPFQIRQTPSLQHRVREHMNDELQAFLLTIDWSYWLVHKEKC